MNHTSKSVINWLILTWTWISVANDLELRFKLPFMDSLNQGKAYSSHEFFCTKKDICWNPPIFSMILVSGLSQFIATAYDIFLYSTESKTRGPWWSYIAHLTKQICIFTVEVSAKFTALGFLYKLYSTNHPPPPPPHPRPCFFTNLDDLNWILKEGHQRNISAKLY